MEIQESSPIIFYSSRLFGLAPYLIKRRPNGKTCEFQLSILLCIYSVLVLLTTVILTCRGLISDAASIYPVRMTTATSKFVTSFDVIVVVGSCFFGVVCGIMGLKHTQGINKKLKEADEVLIQYEDKEKNKRKDLTMLASVLIAISGMIAMDLISRYRILYRKAPADKMDIASTNVLGYIPFYILYYILMALHAQFAQTALGLGRRYRQLNNALQIAFPIVPIPDNKMQNTKSMVHIIRVSSIKKNSSTSGDSTEKKSATTTVTHDTILTNDNFFVDRLSATHASLGEAVGYVSSAYGATLLAMLVSCLLHLVATAYFLFIEILGTNDLFFSMLQFLWLFFHLTRLLLIVEPCHLTTTEARRTIVLVCEIIRNCKDPGITYNLKKFWRQLLAERTYNFSACGMCLINRQILTSISGAIATYLVILIQFQKTDETGLQNDIPNATKQQNNDME